MAKVNDDINPDADLIAAFHPLEPLVANPLISKAFAKFEFLSIAWKAAFHWSGCLSLLSLATATSYVGFTLTLGRDTELARELALPVALVGVVGLALQLFIVIARPRDRWLVNRVTAERIRSLKFQLFGLAGAQPVGPALAALIEERTRLGLGAILASYRVGLAGMKEIDPADIIRDERTEHLDEAACLRVYSAYKALRIDKQIGHFRGQIAACEAKARHPAA